MKLSHEVQILAAYFWILSVVFGHALHHVDISIVGKLIGRPHIKKVSIVHSVLRKRSVRYSTLIDHFFAIRQRNGQHRIQLKRQKTANIVVADSFNNEAAGAAAVVLIAIDVLELGRIGFLAVRTTSEGHLLLDNDMTRG